nr:diacylglycerol kinase [Streptococcus equinus]
MTLYIIANPHSGNRSAKDIIATLKNHSEQNVITFLRDIEMMKKIKLSKF